MPERIGNTTELDLVKRAVITELRTNRRVKHPTAYEDLLDFFVSHRDDYTAIEDVLPFFMQNTDPRQSAMIRISMLNTKLEQHNCRIINIPKRGYRIFMLPEMDS